MEAIKSVLVFVLRPFGLALMAVAYLVIVVVRAVTGRTTLGDDR